MDFNICNHLTDVISLLALFRINVLGSYAHFVASRIYCGNVTTAATWSHQRLSCSLISMNRGIKLAGPLLSCHYQCFKSDFGSYKPIWYLAWSIWKKCCRLGIHVCGVLPSKALWHMFFMISLVVVVLMKTWTALVRPQGGADKWKPKWWAWIRSSGHMPLQMLSDGRSGALKWILDTNSVAWRESYASWCKNLYQLVQFLKTMSVW